MEKFDMQPAGNTERPDVTGGTLAPVQQAVSLLQRLMPLPASGEVLSQLPMLAPMMGRSRGLGVVPIAVPQAPDAAGMLAPDVISRASAVLDEEMARGVLAAQQDASRRDRPGVSNDNLLVQAHQLVDALASMMKAPASGAPGTPPAPTTERFADLRVAVGRPGERATTSMRLLNRGDRSVEVTPLSTDLVSPAGNRLPHGLVQFSPPVAHLGPGTDLPIRIEASIPNQTPSGRYTGLVMVSGLPELRALLTVEVT